MCMDMHLRVCLSVASESVCVCVSVSVWESTLWSWMHWHFVCPPACHVFSDSSASLLYVQYCSLVWRESPARPPEAPRGPYGSDVWSRRRAPLYTTQGPGNSPALTVFHQVNTEMPFKPQKVLLRHKLAGARGVLLRHDTFRRPEHYKLDYGQYRGETLLTVNHNRK